MEIRYKRDLNSNYMILTEEKTAAETYETRMLTENRIHGFLPCVKQEHGDRVEYYYEITGRQSMELMYERRKLGYKELRTLLKELLRALEAAQEYLLNPDHLILAPESMYLNTRSEKLYLCCYPGYEREIRESFLDLAEYLLGKLDKSDAEGIEFGYELYQSALEPNFGLTEVLRRYTEKDRERSAAEPAKRAPSPPPSSVREEVLEQTGSWKNFFKKKNRKPQLEDYVAEADQMGSGSALFLKEEAPVMGTAYLEKEKREGLLLHSLSGDYPDLQIQEESFLIGKKKGAVDGCIPASTVSRIHARITYDGAVYYVEDLNSTNGTWADQVQLNPYELCPLRDGMFVAFAGAEYEVKL